MAKTAVMQALKSVDRKTTESVSDSNQKIDGWKISRNFVCEMLTDPEGHCLDCSAVEGPELQHHSVYGLPVICILSNMFPLEKVHGFNMN